jgi:cytidylate kinase
MAIITISRSSFSKGHEIAERVAEKLGYRCISRDVLLEASEEFNIPEVKLVRALHDAPSVLDRFTHGKERFVAFIRQAFLEQVRGDNVVYHGLAGHFFVEGVRHVLKVRVFADFEERIEREVQKENVSRETAIETLRKDDEERRRWSMALYGVDTGDATLYDMVIHLFKIAVDDAVDIISHTAQLPPFQADAASQNKLDDLLLRAQVASAIVDKWPRAQVTAHQGNVIVLVEAPLAYEPRISGEVTELVEHLTQVKSLRVRVRPPLEG